MKKSIIAIALGAALLAGCENGADVASRNLSTAADNFEIQRRIVFYNGITNQYMLLIEGRCSIGAGKSSESITVTCKNGPGEYVKHQLGLSDNVTYFSEQTQAAKASEYHSRIVFKPQSIIPDIDFKAKVGDTEYD